MAYKSVFTALTSFDETSPALAFSAATAEAQDAHLEVLCVGVDRTPNTYFEIGSNAVVMHAAIETAHESANHIQAEVRAYLQSSCCAGMSSTASPQLQVWDGLSPPKRALRTLPSWACPMGHPRKTDDCSILEGFLFEADCPTVVVPEGAAVARPQSIVIGWNESTEALRAIKAAIPYLQKAKHIHIAIIDPPETGPERSDPGGALAVYLSRHGIRCDINVMTRSGKRSVKGCRNM